MKCEICGRDDIKNLGVHQRFCGKKNVVTPTERLMVDDTLHQTPLSELVDHLKNVLRTFQNSMEIKISEQNGKPFEVQIVTTIKL